MILVEVGVPYERPDKTAGGDMSAIQTVAGAISVSPIVQRRDSRARKHGKELGVDFHRDFISDSFEIITPVLERRAYDIKFRSEARVEMPHRLSAQGRPKHRPF